MHDPDARHVRIAIVGTGFSGLGIAIRLKQAGYTDLLLFERADEVGGVWRDNTYPGCACDVESHLYSLSFAPNPHWSRAFSPQAEILAYLKDCAERFDVLPHVRFRHELQRAEYDVQDQRWQLTTSRGQYTADVLIGGMGALSEPAIPQLPGLEKFRGTSFHSARWDHDFDLHGKRVAVVGTGASAIQFVPQIQPKVASLTLLQRTPAWVIPRMDRVISETEKWLFEHLPAARELIRASIYARRELLVLGFRNPGVMKLLERFALRYLKREVADPVLRDKLTPDFRLGCKRILITADYLPAVTQPNVRVETSGIREVREHSLVTNDGTEHALDAILFGTGFQVTDLPFAHHVYGRHGRSLHDCWGGSPQALLGTSCSGFPNFFMLLGPNTGLGHSSVIHMMESQFQLILETLRYMDRHGFATVEPRAEAQAHFVAEVDRGLDGTVWNAGGCASWYLDATGRNSTLWPSFTFSFRRRAHFRPGDYILASRAQPPRAADSGVSGDGRTVPLSHS